MEDIINNIDKIASRLETSGLLKHASKLDEVSNSLEKESKLMDYLKGNSKNKSPLVRNPIERGNVSMLTDIINGEYLESLEKVKEHLDDPKLDKVFSEYFAKWKKAKSLFSQFGLSTSGDFNSAKFEESVDNYTGSIKSAADIDARGIDQHKKEVEGLFSAYKKALKEMGKSEYSGALNKLYFEHFLGEGGSLYYILDEIISGMVYEESEDFETVEDENDEKDLKWFFSNEGIEAIKGKIQDHIVGPFKFDKPEAEERFEEVSGEFNDNLVSEWARVSKALSKFGIDSKAPKFDGDIFWDRFNKFESLVKFAASEDTGSVYREIDNAQKSFELGLKEFSNDPKKKKALIDTYHELIMSSDKGFYNKVKDSYESSQKEISSLNPERVSEKDIKSEGSEAEEYSPDSTTKALIDSVDDSLNKEILKSGHYLGMVDSFKHLSIAPDTARSGESSRKEKQGYKDQWDKFIKLNKSELNDLDKAQNSQPNEELSTLLDSIYPVKDMSPLDKKKKLLADMRVSSSRIAKPWKDFVGTAIDFTSFEGTTSARKLKNLLQGRLEGVGGPEGLFSKNLSNTSQKREKYTPTEFTEESRGALKKLVGVYLDPTAYANERSSLAKEKEESLKDKNKSVEDKLEDSADILEGKIQSGSEESIEESSKVIQEYVLPSAKKLISEYAPFFEVTGKALSSLGTKLPKRVNTSLEKVVESKDVTLVDALVSDLKGIFDELQGFSKTISIPEESAQEAAKSFFDSVITDIKDLAIYLSDVREAIVAGNISDEDLSLDIGRHRKMIDSVLSKANEFKKLIDKLKAKDTSLKAIDMAMSAPPLDLKPSDLKHNILPIIESYKDTLDAMSKGKMPSIAPSKMGVVPLPDYKSVMSELNRHSEMLGYLNVAKSLAHKISESGEVTEDDKKAIDSINEKVVEEVEETKKSAENYESFLSEMDTELKSLLPELDEITAEDIDKSEAILGKAKSFLDKFPKSSSSLTKSLKDSVSTFIKDLEFEFRDLKDRSSKEAEDSVSEILAVVNRVSKNFKSRVDIDKIEELSSEINTWLTDTKEGKVSYLNNLSSIIDRAVLDVESSSERNDKMTKAIAGEGLDIGDSKTTHIPEKESESKSLFIKHLKGNLSKSLSRYVSEIFELEDIIGESDELNEMLDKANSALNAIDRVSLKSVPNALYSDFEKKSNKVISLINGVIDGDKKEQNEGDLLRKVNRALSKIVDNGGKLIMVDRDSVKNATGIDARSIVSNFLGKEAKSGKAVEVHNWYRGNSDVIEQLPDNYEDLSGDKKEKAVKRSLGAIAARNGSKNIGLDVHKMYTSRVYKVVDKDLNKERLDNKKKLDDERARDQWEESKMRRTPKEKVDKSDPDQTSLF